MAFIGNTNTTQAFTPAIDYFSGNASTTAFTLSRPVASVAQVQVTIDNVAQNPSSAYTVSANTITFTSAPLSGTNNIYVYYTSPITQVIAPGQNTVSTTSLATNFTLPVANGGTGSTSTTFVNLTSNVTGTLPVANGGTGLTTVPHTMTVYTSGSGTYTTPTNCKAIYIQMVGGGGNGGSGASGAGGGGGAGGYLEVVINSPSASYTYAVGAAGGNTTFNSTTYSANGGSVGTAGTTSANGGGGGTATGGSLNITGATGGYGWGSAPYYNGGYGAASFFGGGGMNSGTNNGNGSAGVVYGSGGGGGVGGGIAGAGVGGLIIITEIYV
jgi:hypothetical protein